jgi:vancomycin resistance protein YoaR
MATARSKQKVIVLKHAPAGARSTFPWLRLLVLGLLTAAALLATRWETGMDGMVYPGVRVAGVDIGNRSLAEARARLEQVTGRVTDRVITVSAADRRWQVTPSQLGLRFDLEGRLRESYALGRDNSLLDRLSTQAGLLVQGRDLTLGGSYDRTKLEAFVRQMAMDSYQAAQPATVSLIDARASITAHASPGHKLDQNAAAGLLATALSGLGQTRVTVPMIALQPAVSEAEARREAAALQSILQARVRMHFGAQQWQLSASSIAQAISLTTITASGGGATYHHALDQAALTSYVNGLATQIDRPMRPATVTVHDARIAVVPAQDGRHLDRFTARDLLAQAILAGGTQNIALPGGNTPATTPTSAAQAAARQAAELIRHPLALTYGAYSWLLGPSQLGDALVFVPRQDPLNGPIIDVQVDQARLAVVLRPAVDGLETPAVDARFVVAGNRVLLSPARSGTRVDLALLAPQIEARGRISQIALPMQSYEPARTTAKAEAMGIREPILTHTTTFAGSSAARLTNIDAAVRHLDGQLIAPGEVFSFNQRIGPITPAGGYVEGINIVDNQDVPGIGGGVCQVAVTLFQAAVYAGFPIRERVNHANVVSYYNPIGMDATVYVATGGPDVKFENNTGHWVLVSFAKDLPHASLTVRFFGTNPRFRVVLRGPIVTDHPNGDVDAVFYRTVYDRKGAVLLDHAFTSHYVPVGAAPTQ